MRKALICARVQLHLYVRSGRILFPMLLLIGYPLVFYHVLPVDVASSFLLSSAAAFAWGAWLALALYWSEDPTLRQIFIVKSGMGRYHTAQSLALALLGAAGGALLIALPMLARITCLPGMFARDPAPREVLLGICLNACAGMGGASLGGVFHPNIIRDRKLAYLLCLLAGLLGFVGGMAGFPLSLRLLFPPLYDSIRFSGASASLEALPGAFYCAWHILYAMACTGIRLFALTKMRER